MAIKCFTGKDTVVVQIREIDTLILNNVVKINTVSNLKGNHSKL